MTYFAPFLPNFCENNLGLDSDVTEWLIWHPTSIFQYMVVVEGIIVNQYLYPFPEENIYSCPVDWLQVWIQLALANKTLSKSIMQDSQAEA